MGLRCFHKRVVELKFMKLCFGALGADVFATGYKADDLHCCNSNCC
jgi:hypothetical protein